MKLFVKTFDEVEHELSYLRYAWSLWLCFSNSTYKYTHLPTACEAHSTCSRVGSHSSKHWSYAGNWTKSRGWVGRPSFTRLWYTCKEKGHTLTLSVTCWLPFPLRVLFCVFVCCEITGDTGVGCDPGEGGKTLVSGLLSEADVSLPTSISFTAQHFVSRSLASWLAPTLRLLRESVRVFQVELSLVLNQALSISRSWSLGSGNCVLILSNVPVLTLSRSPRLYHCAAASRTASNTSPRSSEVSLLPEKSEREDVISCRIIL